LTANELLPADLRVKCGASDLVQDTFLQAQQDFPRFRGPNGDALRGWLRRILLNRLTDFSRRYRDADKRRLGREVVVAEGVLDALPQRGSPRSPRSQAIAREESEALRRALDRLPEEAQQVIQWRSFDRCTFEEIGRRLGRSAEAARKVWSRALEQLQGLLEPPA
jgi:RNA polymerase sigma-70 factor (ECF subfamily)